MACEGYGTGFLDSGVWLRGLRAMGTRRRHLTWPWEECSQGRVLGGGSRVWESPKGEGIGQRSG